MVESEIDKIANPQPVDFDPFADGEIVLTAPATESQKEIWLSVKLGGDDANCAFNESISLKLSGPLDTDFLHTSFQMIIQRHDALRTTFSPNGETLCINSSHTLDIPSVDLVGLNKEQRDNRIKDIKRHEVELPFDLERGPLIRAQIVKLEVQQSLLIFTAHHIICDGWSTGVLLKELGLIYSSLKQGVTPNLIEPYQFSEYTLAAEEIFKTPEYSDDERFWLQKFKGDPPLLDLPIDKKRPSLRSFRSARVDRKLDRSLVANLRQIGAKAGCTFFMTVLAGFKAFLYRISKQEDLIVGIPSAGQANVGKDNLIGHCVNILPIRSQLDDELSFSDYLKAVRKALLDAYDHQLTTFGSLLKNLMLPRDPSRIPLLPVVFNLDSAIGDKALGFEKLDVELSSNPRSFENFELFINGVDYGESVVLECQYNKDLFDQATIARMLNHFQTMLEGIVADPGNRLRDLPLLTKAERHKMIVEWNDTATEYPEEKCIHELFEEQVKKFPDAVAVVFQGNQLTYRQLNDQANQLSNYLRSLGVDLEIPVGIFMERSLEMLVGILGILKSGGAYVPMDIGFPKKRLGYILEDAQISTVLTQQHLEAELPDNGVKVIPLDTINLAEAAEKTSVDKLSANVVKPNNLAYIIYTSGSTGKPKGVLVTHHNVVRLMKATEPWYGFCQDDVWTLFHSIAFDFSVWEIWGALLYGGRLIIVQYEISRSPKEFYNLLMNEKVTVLNQTPSAFYQLIRAEESIQGEKNLCLRLVIFGGEALEIQSLKPWFKNHGDLNPQLVNMYGITETTVHVTYRPITNQDLQNGQGSVIGTPIPDLQLYVLDRNLQPVPIGVAGELFVGGAGLARGYLNRPELTKERFIPDPFVNKPTAHLYRTGDVARFHPNRDLEFLGRADQQIQIRGFRVELGEIETVMTEHEKVNQAVAIVRGEQPDIQQLGAYFVSTPNQNTSVVELRKYLQNKLPEYMIPQYFIELDTIPLTSNGKVDRKALPAPDNLRPELTATYVEPATEAECAIADVWKEVLNLKAVGVNDSFFELGGHSLLATQVLSRINRSFQVNMKLHHLFNKFTIAQLSEALEDTLMKEIDTLTEQDAAKLLLEEEKNEAGKG
ncbi:amino acid adenylation domain-containing protein [Desulfobacterales bacterium]|nr:amino acid adenylation domain-containing protein [Desulfobacterales bacterium]